MPPPQSTIDQPRGDGHCFIYAPMCAYEITRNVTPNVNVFKQHADKLWDRMGGNTNDAFRVLCGFGTTRADSYKSKWKSFMKTASANKHPVAIGVSWTKGGARGNHWIYYVGMCRIDDKEHIQARDQQNEHHLITISTKNWTGIYKPEGKGQSWHYTVTNIGIGCANDKEAGHYTY